MPRDYKKEYQNYHASPEQKKKRALRNAARRELMKKGVVSKGDGYDVHHPQPLAKGGDNKQRLEVKKASENRSFKRTKKARMK